MTYYKIIEFNSNRNRERTLGKFDTRKEAEKRCEELFFDEFYDSDCPELYGYYVGVALPDGRQISYNDFLEKEEFAGIEDFRYVFTGTHSRDLSWNHAGRYYYIEEEEDSKKEEIIEQLKNKNEDFIEIHLFYYSRDYHNAANLHTDTMAVAETIDFDDFQKLKIEGKIVDYTIHELTRDDYARTLIANSCIEIDDIWDEDCKDEIAYVVRILLDLNAVIEE